VIHPTLKIIDLTREDKDLIKQTASLLFRGFREHNPNGWPTLAAARNEVMGSLKKDHISRIAVGKEGKVLGWIGGLRAHTNLWELHPIVVEKECRHTGIGSAIIKDFEKEVKKRGGLTIYLGADDEDFMTTVSGVDLFPNPLDHLMRIKNIKGHPYGFYQKMGYALVGVIPDADGIGKPDIIMAKRVGS
jgi:aminoglycoside 6'-N-acetyltransferase I